MRVTFVVPTLEVSGGARIIAGHAKRLAIKGHEVLIVVPGTGRPRLEDRVRALLGRSTVPLRQDQATVRQAGVPVRMSGYNRPIGPADVPDADVVIASWWETAEWMWHLPASKGAKVHFLQHYEVHPNLPTDRVDAVWRLPTAKIAVAQWLVDLGKERFSIDDIALAPNSVDHELFRPTARRKGRPPTVGFLFHEASFKDVPTSFAAVKRLSQSIPETQIVSFGAARPVPGQLREGTEFHYLPTQEQIADIYGRCDAWLSTSLTEGFNLPPLEAMASGCPAVCSKTGRPLEIIENGVNGYLVDAGDVDGFARALASILSLTEEAWRAMSEAAVRSVAHPTWEESNDLFERALIRAVDQGTA